VDYSNPRQCSEVNPQVVRDDVDDIPITCQCRNQNLDSFPSERNEMSFKWTL